MPLQTLRLAASEPTLYGVKVGYWDCKPEKPVFLFQHFAQGEGDNVAQFIFDKDRRLVMDVFGKWYRQAKYNTSNIYNPDTRIYAVIKSAMVEVLKHITTLQNPRITPNEAGKVSELLSMEWLRLKPS